jgi:tetratricopeptide (TPR) repeat protein
MDLDRALRDGKGEDCYEWVVMTNRDGRVPPVAFESAAATKGLGAENRILRWRLRLMAHDPAGALADLEFADVRLSHQWHDYPRALLVAIAHELAGNGADARSHYEIARDTARAEIAAHPDDARAHAPLALALAGLGQRDEALREARHATEMLPIERDSVVGGALLLDRFYTELRVGALDEAVRTLEAYLAHPAPFSLRALVLDPRLDALTDHVGFEELRKRRKAR